MSEMQTIGELIAGFSLCRNCKWWTDKREHMNRHSDHTHKTCDCPSIIEVCHDYMVHNYAPDTLIHKDHEGYKAMLETGPDFGCVHWKQNREF